MSKDDKTVQGNHNVVAGRDVIYFDALSLNKQLRERLLEIDNKINDFLPTLLTSPTTNNSLEKFSSEKMLQSLLKIGIPFSVAFDVIDSLDAILIDLIKEEDRITTRILRKAVSLSIYSFKIDKYGASQLQYWGGQYARCYGAPETQVTIEELDGSTSPLDYKF